MGRGKHVNTKEQKFCYKCQTMKPRSEFGKNSSKADGNNSECKECKQYKDTVASTYNISMAEYKAMILKQDNKCAICGNTQNKALAVDHNHTTGEVRGLLCTSCNVGLGLFKDRIDLLLQAIEYLKKN